MQPLTNTFATKTNSFMTTQGVDSQNMLKNYKMMRMVISKKIRFCGAL